MRTETKDILKAWLALSVAFAILLRGLRFDSGFIVAIGISAFTVGIGFLAHELSHKFVAQRYGCWAEFRSFDAMLLIAIAMSFFGFILAAPGGVFIKGRGSLKHNGIISAAGPLASIVIALVFLLLAIAVPIASVKQVVGYGFTINSWLALFNMLPFAMLDGQKILSWSKPVYFTMLAVSIGLVFGLGAFAL